MAALYHASVYDSANPVPSYWEATAPPPPRPNVLLAVLDTVRADSLDLFGYERATMPNLAAFAREQADHHERGPPAGALYAPQLDEPVVQKDAISGLEIFGEVSVGGGDVSLLDPVLRGQSDGVPGFERHRLRELTYTNLGAGEVGDDRQGPPGLLGGLTQVPDELGVPLVVPV